jgi:iron complex outermembrane recepter protein
MQAKTIKNLTYRSPNLSMYTFQASHKFHIVALGLAITLAMQAQGAEEVEEVTITGSRIQRTSGLETPTPVTSVGMEDLADMNPRQMVEGLSQLPQFLNNQRPQNTGSLTSGGSNLNLRGAGSTRTLVLLNGRRIPSGNRYGVVNVSSLPEAAIRNVEIVTGGASAAYGTDAVAGVVNFILDTNYEGFEANAQMGTTSRKDGDNYGFGATWGKAIGDKGHLLITGDFFDQDLIQSLDALQSRPWFTQRAWVTNPTPGGPTFITRDFVRQTNTSATGIINQPGSALNKLEFVSNGDQITTQPLRFNGVGRLDGGCNCFAETERDKSWGMDADNAVQNGNARHSVFVYGDYDVSDNLNVFVQGIYGFAQIYGPWFTTPILTGAWQGRIFSGNPFLPANVQATMDTEGLASVGFGLSGLSRYDKRGPLDFYSSEQNDELNSITTGFEYDFTGGFLDGWRANYYAQYGENNQEMIFHNGLRVDHLLLGMDAVRDPRNGATVCRAALVNPATFGDCVPVNLFGGVDSISPQAASYLLDEEAKILSDSEQVFTELVLDGEVYEGIGAGPVMMALGASYRRDEILQRKDDLHDEFVYLNGQSTGFRGLIPENLPNGMLGVREGSVPTGYQGNNSLSSTLFTGTYQTPDTVLAGHFAVKEVFTELDIPLLADRSFAQGLDLNLAYRYADYTGSGGIDSWKYGISWQIVDALRFRATRSRDVRAANIRERFDATAGGANVNDPVFGNAVFATSSRTGGNPSVNPEEADTATFGFVWQPAGSLEGLGASVDWFDIDVKDALGQLSFQNIVNGCYSGAQELCQYVLRDPVNNQITRIDSLFINISNQRLKGIDLEMNYNTDIDLFGGGETLSLRVFASQIIDSYNQLPGAPRDNLALEQPEWRILPAIAYSRGGFRAFLQGRYFDERTLNRLFIEGVNVDDNSVPSVTYADLNLSYEMDISGHSYRFFGNVTNLFDRAPPQTPGNLAFTGGSAGPNGGLYDTIGRTYAVGVNLEF